MKYNGLKYSMFTICKLHMMSRQAYYKHMKKRQEKEISEDIVVSLVRSIRKRQPMTGGKKLYYLLKSELKKLAIRIGRDNFFKILRKHNLLIKRKNKYVRTTDSNHSYFIYINLIKELDSDVVEPDQVIVSDLTCLSTYDRFYYLSLVTDVGSRKITGYSLSDKLTFDGCLKAVKMSLRGISDRSELIHHSDRGIQYCSYKFVKCLKQNGIKISMSSKGNPYDNAIAERVIGILKQEYLSGNKFCNYSDMKKSVKQAIDIYNTERPYLSIGMLTPSQRYAA